MNEEQLQELEQLRAEKQLREQTQRARTALEEAGVPAAFAELLVGRDDEDPDASAQRFCAAYQQAVAEDVRQRLPQQAPAVTTPTPQRVKRGVQRLR